MAGMWVQMEGLWDDACARGYEEEGCPSHAGLPFGMLARAAQGAYLPAAHCGGLSASRECCCRCLKPLYLPLSGPPPTSRLYRPAVLEQSTLGVPHSALPLLGTGLMLVVFVSAAMPWWSAKAVPALLLWLNGSQRAVAAVRARVGGGGAKRRSPAKATSRSPLQRPPR